MTIRPSLKATLVAGAALGALATAALPAHAADLIEPVIIEAPVIEKVKPFGGWYIRADLDYSFFQDRRGLNDPADGIGFGNACGTPPCPTTPVAPFDIKRKTDFGEGISIGAGVGYQISPFLRADITAEGVFGQELTTTESSPLGEGDSGLSADYDAVTVMANAYVDMGTYAGITPYVGAGIGFAHISYEDVKYGTCEGTFAPNAPAPGTRCAPADTEFTSSADGKNSLRLAWSLAAGASYDVTDAIAIDGGYRFTRIMEGDVATIPLGTGDINNPGTLSDGGIDMHSIRVGARYRFH